MIQQRKQIAQPEPLVHSGTARHLHAESKGKDMARSSTLDRRTHQQVQRRVVVFASFYDLARPIHVLPCLEPPRGVCWTVCARAFVSEKVLSFLS